MVGLHIRNVFDAPRDAVSNVSTEGVIAMEGAQKEYGFEGTQKLLQWRRASHWTNFVNKMISMMREQRVQRVSNNRSAEPPLLRFYLAADSEDAYAGMAKRFPGRLIFTRRECAAKRCDFRDCRCACTLKRALSFSDPCGGKDAVNLPSSRVQLQEHGILSRGHDESGAHEADPRFRLLIVLRGGGADRW